MRAIRRAILHCSYTRPSMDWGVAEVRRVHVEENGWSDTGYHYVLKRDGTVEIGRPIERPGAHAIGHNADSIGICLIGGMAEEDRRPDCNFTADQWGALEALVVELAVRFPGLSVIGHRDVAPGRACPTFDAAAWAASLRSP